MAFFFDSLFGAPAEADALRKAAIPTYLQGRREQQLAAMQALDVLNRGNVAAGTAHTKGSLIAATQRAGYAAAGVDVTQGSAAQTQADTERTANLNALTLVNNARRAAWGYNMKSMRAGEQADLALISSNDAAQAGVNAARAKDAIDFFTQGFSGLGGGGGRRSGGTALTGSGANLDIGGSPAGYGGIQG